MTLQIKNKSIDTIRRRRTAGNRKIDYEDPYWGVKKPGIWTCKICGGDMIPWKQSRLGDIIVTCQNSFCVKSKDFAGSINVELSKLLREQQNNSSLYYRKYDGGFH